MSKKWTKEAIASTIDHTNLKATAEPHHVKKLCDEAMEYHFASVCVNPCYAKLVSEKLKGTPVKTCIVVGFPLGANTSAIKAAETRQAITDGADEIDMVINIGMLKSGEYDYVENDIRAVVDAAGPVCVKVILENCYLTDDEKAKACLLSEKAGAPYVKTSTGMGPGGATVEDVQLMERILPTHKIKAAGGIGDLETAIKMLEAGADRIGASASIALVESVGEREREESYRNSH
ncbi:MAG: deoxyribose-phosphate aldolase [Spirochaetaceae bacterium]|jgi:deoxyribose-phosphate aldolase|nr:deoxyribose-phosphate aldolase [Spirochaetaceae bacterium]